MNNSQNESLNLKVKICNQELDNPIIGASGTFGFGYEMSQWFDINIMGGICLKGTTKNARIGNEQPRIAEIEGGMLNSIGLQNPGVHEVINTEIKKLKNCFSKKIIANIAGSTEEEYLYVASAFDECNDISFLEVNLSCPNVKEGGITFGHDINLVTKIINNLKKYVKKPLFVKLSPNTGKIVEISKAAQFAGADGLVLINCLRGCALDFDKFLIKQKIAGLSGPAIKSIALRIIYEVYKEVSIPIIGVGGIKNADDVIEFISVGASAVQIGSANLSNPMICPEIIKELPQKMEKYNIKKISSIIGRAHMN